MRRVERMLLQLNANFDGNPWHGTSLRRIVDGIDDAKANAHILANSMTIHELLAHVTAWNEIVAKMIGGEVVTVTPEIDFPKVDGVAWADTVARLERAHTKLIDAVARMKDSDFDAIVPGKKYDADTLLQGILEHNTYHAAQIALLKKQP